MQGFGMFCLGFSGQGFFRQPFLGHMLAVGGCLLRVSRVWQRTLVGAGNPSARRAGLSLVEVLVSLALLGLLVGMSVQLLTQNPRGPWVARVSDYLAHVAALAHRVELSTGRPVDVSAGGLATLLLSAESAVETIMTSPAHLRYPSGVWVYLYPEQVSGMSDPIFAGTHNREWLLLDLNGDQSPNALSEQGDRVLLHLNSQSGRIQTAYQINMLAFDRSFFDAEKQLAGGNVLTATASSGAASSSSSGTAGTTTTTSSSSGSASTSSTSTGTTTSTTTGCVLSATVTSGGSTVTGCTLTATVSSSGVTLSGL
ncbi:MAG: prepilin-type N-terminal cleavage/methylation domain-containing protein [Candidatus Melainabacteria bacterium]|nr:prepilin-type N-terminal cleavage/methylation domain-containing protein [Candidatus Melainabacteria bacterium]